MALKPNAIIAADIGIAQRPSLGAEVFVYACTEPAGLIKTVKNLGGTYETKTLNAAGYGGIDVVVVGAQGLHGAIAGIIENPSWSVNKALTFPTGKAGPGTIPGTFGTRGDELLQVQIPDYDPAAVTPIWFEVGCTTDKKLKFPTRMSKAIGCGMIASRWVVPGKTQVGELSITAKHSGHEEGLAKIAGLKTTIMLKVMHESVLEIARIFILDWTPSPDSTYGNEDAESEITATGLFSTFAAISADGP
jgi:hypothetical protein